MMVDAKVFLRSYTKELSYGVDDLHACEHEPISSCGAIQSIGFFLAAEFPSLDVQSVSQNLEAFSGYSIDEILKINLQDLLRTSEGQRFQASSIEEVRQLRFPQLLLVKKSGETAKLKVLVNLVDGHAKALTADQIRL